MIAVLAALGIVGLLGIATVAARHRQPGERPRAKHARTGNDSAGWFDWGDAGGDGGCDGGGDGGGD